MANYRSNVIRVSIGETISAAGNYFDSKDKWQHFKGNFKSEQTMHETFETMKHCDCDFQLVIERKA